MSALVDYNPNSPPINDDAEYERMLDGISVLLSRKQNWRYAAAIARHAVFAGISFGSSSLAMLCYRILHGMLTDADRNYVPMETKMVDVLAALDEPDPAEAVAKARLVILGNLIPQNRTAP